MTGQKITPPWRDLPSDFGRWKTVYNRFDRWSRTGRWASLFDALADDVDAAWHSLDSTINRAHQHAAGGKGGAAAQVIGWSRGGRSTKVHLVVAALGLAGDFAITVGAIFAYIEAHNDEGKPFVWTKTADEILNTVKRFGQRTLQVHRSNGNEFMPESTDPGH